MLCVAFPPPSVGSTQKQSAFRRVYVLKRHINQGALKHAVHRQNRLCSLDATQRLCSCTPTMFNSTPKTSWSGRFATSRFGYVRGVHSTFSTRACCFSLPHQRPLAFLCRVCRASLAGLLADVHILPSKRLALRCHRRGRAAMTLHVNRG